jgi:hypothetical protein
LRVYNIAQNSLTQCEALGRSPTFTAVLTEYHTFSANILSCRIHASVHGT